MESHVRGGVAVCNISRIKTIFFKKGQAMTMHDIRKSLFGKPGPVYLRRVTGSGGLDDCFLGLGGSTGGGSRWGGSGVDTRGGSMSAFQASHSPDLSSGLGIGAIGDEIYEENREIGSGSARVEVAKRANRGGRDGGESSLAGFDGRVL